MTDTIISNIINKINKLQEQAEAIPFIDENEAWKRGDKKTEEQARKNRDVRFELSNEQQKLKRQLWDIKVEAWKLIGECGVCGIKYNSDFEFFGSLAVDSKIKGRCQTCKDKKRCETCEKWVDKVGWYELKGGLFSSFYKLIYFCDKDCRKKAQKLAKVEIENYNNKT